MAREATTWTRDHVGQPYKAFGLVRFRSPCAQVRSGDGALVLPRVARRVRSHPSLVACGSCALIVHYFDISSRPTEPTRPRLPARLRNMVLPAARAQGRDQQSHTSLDAQEVGKARTRGHAFGTPRGACGETPRTTGAESQKPVDVERDQDPPRRATRNQGRPRRDNRARLLAGIGEGLLRGRQRGQKSNAPRGSRGRLREKEGERGREGERENERESGRGKERRERNAPRGICARQIRTQHR